MHQTLPLLLEIGTEEIPAGFLAPAFERLADAARKLFAAQHIPISAASLVVTGTPRRLVLSLQLATKQQDTVTTITGPPKRLAYDADGNPTKAAQGFANNQGVALSDIGIVTTEKGDYLSVEKRHEGRATNDLLPALLAQLVQEMPFPKSMRWGSGSLRFARPIRWIVALFGEALIEFTVDGLAVGRVSRGHRFKSRRPVELASADFDAYCKMLGKQHVIVHHEVRRRKIARQLNKVAREHDGNPLDNADLLDTVTQLVESPKVVCGSFQPAYLGLPAEVLITTMVKHQKYFPIIDASGALLPKFLTVSNMPIRDLSHIRTGNERVLAARLADAKFFFDEDRKTPLEDLVEQLKSVIYQERLGTSYEKVERIEQLTDALAARFAPQERHTCRRVARLCKADLNSHMVGEFPELQGVMGREYARHQGEAPEVCVGIYEHYLPRFAGDASPRAIHGALVSLADKLDTIVGCFGIGLIPTGSEDPHALRRQAAAIAAIILGHNLELDIAEAIGWAGSQLDERFTRPKADVEGDVLEFFKGRMQTLLVSRAFTAAVVDAVLARQARDLVDAQHRCEALERFRTSDEFQALMTLIKRTNNIVRDFAGARVDPSLLHEDAERALFEAFELIRDDVQRSVASKDYAIALSKLVTLKGRIDTFFDDVLVMCEDEALRTNRLSLLRGITDLFSPLADFPRLAST